MSVLLRAVFDNADEADAAIAALQRRGIRISSMKLFPNRQYFSESGLMHEFMEYSRLMPGTGRDFTPSGPRSAESSVGHTGDAFLQISVPEEEADAARACLISCRGHRFSKLQ